MTNEKPAKKLDQSSKAEAEKMSKTSDPAHKLKQAEGEIGGPSGLEPTRYGDWERKGIISDF
ncbi:DUF1674 domain-containing protein [Sneathiella glossodoripedis]|uniref:DUF1674 domain-containing protein n=1 Tax=Sneathiella glossodoripedis TaxID=418853 RepID=UPI00046FB02F|nr:succinate dehydrogenase assembly factor 4 [Sneathiella glossodoripedis]